MKEANSSHPPLLSSHGQDWLVSRLLAAHREGGCSVVGLHGSLMPLILARVFLEHTCCHLVAFEEEDQAACCYDDLLYFLGGDHVHYFPHAQTTSKEQQKSNYLIRRNRVLRCLSQTGVKHVVVSYAAALLETVIKKEAATSLLFSLKKGDAIDRTALFSYLEAMHFEPSPITRVPGEFSSRGGIVDIFPYNHPNPVRVELFDGVVGSIRVFDADTQYSTRECPAVDLMADGHPAAEGADVSSIFSYFPPGSYLWTRDWKRLVQTAERCRQPSIQETPSPDVRETSAAVFSQAEKNFVHVACSAFPRDSGGSEAGAITYRAAPQPTFGKDYPRMVAYLNDLQKKDYTLYLAASSELSVQHLQALCSKRAIPLALTPLPRSMSEGFVNHEYQYALFTDHQLFGNKPHRHSQRRVAYLKQSRALKDMHALQIGDYVTHIDHGIGRFVSLKRVERGGALQEVLCLLFSGGDMLHVNVQSLWKLAKYADKMSGTVVLSKLGDQAWSKKKKRVKEKLEGEVEVLMVLYAQRKAVKGYAYPPDDFLQLELEASFVHTDTPDQVQATRDIKRDMGADSPMDRLICGDAGFGKDRIGNSGCLQGGLQWQAGGRVGAHHLACLPALPRLQGQNGRLWCEDRPPQPLSQPSGTKRNSQKAERGCDRGFDRHPTAHAQGLCL